MKNFISKAEKYLVKNYKYIILIILILIILILILFILNVEKQVNKNIVGTYIMGEAITGDAEYFVFDNNNYYCRYKQFDVLEEGEYEKIHDNIYVLNNKSKEHIVKNNDEIYYFNQEEVYFYSRIDDAPIFINVHSEKSY